MSREGKDLRAIGCCALCALRFQSARLKEDYLGVPFDLLKNEEARLCVACLGILPALATDDAWHDKILESIAQYPHAVSYAVAMSLPVATVLRQTLIAIYHADIVGVPFTDPMDIKEVGRWVLSSALSSRTSLPFDLTSPLLIHLHIAHPETASEHLILQDIPSAQFSIRKVFEKGKAVMQGEGAGHVEQALKRVKTGDLKRRTDIPPTRIKQQATLDSIKQEHAPIYLGGRYKKHDRLTSQTRWITEGDFKVDNSVEQYLGEPAMALFKASGYSFMSAGREDVDVRMLGTGRPFALCLSDPHVLTLPPSALHSLTTLSSSPAVSFSSLRLVHKSALQLLKDGEADKKKTYAAIIRTSRHVTDEEVSRIGHVRELVLEQDTPVRVLHRRAPATRRKVIHEMRVKRLRGNYLRVQLTTQAGTYIKEFVHGDFGRTRPDLGDILSGAYVIPSNEEGKVAEETTGATAEAADAKVERPPVEECRADLIELDVVEVQLPWPPETDADVPVEHVASAAGGDDDEDEMQEDE